MRRSVRQDTSPFQQKNIKIARKSIDKNKRRRYNKTIERRWYM
nr:MAG TPA: hypothetical protein [Caudoviricetes sp.]